MLTRVHPVELMKDSAPRFAGVVESHDDPIHQRREFINWVQSGKSCALPDFPYHHHSKRCSKDAGLQSLRIDPR